MELLTEYSSITADNIFLFIVYIQEKQITLSNLHITVSGRIVRSFDPSNVRIEHVDVDYYMNSAGFNLDQS